MKNILVTGGAGFIGYHLCHRLIREKKFNIFCLDNLNDYYDVELKFSRLENLGFSKKSILSNPNLVNSEKYKLITFYKIDISNSNNIIDFFKNHKIDIVCHLAAQAGVRFSIENPNSYIESNIVGFHNILEAVRNNSIGHLVYASSSSVYGENSKIPFSVNDSVDKPVSLYAATKKSNELMAYSYSNLYNFFTTGLRFFTVYGPWGRPDMAYFLFANAIRDKKPIKLFNEGKMLRDFTFIDDIIEGVFRVLTEPVKDEKYKIYNIGNNKSEDLMKFIDLIESEFGEKAEKLMYPMQAGDVKRTWADCQNLIDDYNYSPSTTIETGVKKFIDWYKNYYKLQ